MGDPRNPHDERPPLRVIRGDRADVPEAELVAAFVAGDDAAFGALVRRHEDLVLRIVRRYAITSDDARDLAQRTFLRTFQAARRALALGARSTLPFRALVIRVAVNLAKNHVRDATRYARAPLEAIDAERAAPPEAHEAVLRAEREARLRTAVLRLPRRQREVLTLRVDAELPFAEIALSLGITENSAKVSFHHAARRLREELAAEESR